MHIQSTPSTRSTWYLAVPTDEIVPVLAVPAAPNPVLGSTGSAHSSDEPRNAASPEVSAAHSLELLRILAVYAVHKPQVLRVPKVPPVAFLENTKILHSQVLGVSVHEQKRPLSLALACVDCQTPPANAVASSSPRTRGRGASPRFHRSYTRCSRESSGGAMTDFLQ